jgi:hypothetical protein
MLCLPTLCRMCTSLINQAAAEHASWLAVASHVSRSCVPATGASLSSLPAVLVCCANWEWVPIDGSACCATGSLYAVRLSPTLLRRKKQACLTQRSAARSALRARAHEQLSTEQREHQQPTPQGNYERRC